MPNESAHAHVRRCLAALLLLLCVPMFAGEPPPDGVPDRYTFSWPLDESRGSQPRGGSTRGTAVQLDLAPSPAWLRLQETGITPFERDRRAILAMAGEYRVRFDFLEVVTFEPGRARDAPYQSWGTEKVYVAEDRGSFISLVHVLEMHMLRADGTAMPPMVTKHWRQDWQFEPDARVDHLGGHRWQRVPVAAQDAAGRWAQTVWQVDESPRYSALGQWQHTPTHSTWLSFDTIRPLPRREWSVRRDYDQLVGSNRHTVTATGWLQEENNLKSAPAAPANGTSEAEPRRDLAREYGVARYDRISGFGFAAADAQYTATHAFWQRVRDAWAALFDTGEVVQLRGASDQLGAFMPLFEAADAQAEGRMTAAEADAVITRALLDLRTPAP